MYVWGMSGLYGDGHADEGATDVVGLVEECDFAFGFNGSCEGVGQVV